MADTPDFSDINCCMIIDLQDGLWLLWPTIQANTWENTLMDYKVSTDYMQPNGSPNWESHKIRHMKPGSDFEDKVQTTATE